MERPADDINEEKGGVVAAISSTNHTESYATADEGLINASGHRQQLDRNFNLISICSYAITAGNSWVSLGGSIVGVCLYFLRYLNRILL